MEHKVLVINAGSSSIKWKLFAKADLAVIASGLVERIGVDGSQEMQFGAEKIQTNLPTANHQEAVGTILNLWTQHRVLTSPTEVTNIGFRIVHGGTYFKKPALIDEVGINQIKAAAKFAPLHNPGALAAIAAFKAFLPQALLSANFDTTFHTSIPEVNHTYPMNRALAQELEIKKYGMHGISHRYITTKLSQILKQPKVTFVNLHIGNGASLCAIKDSQSFDTTMGLTPLAGIMMGTRSGDIDPSIHEYVCQAKNISIGEFTKILNKQSGLLGVSGFSSDMREISAAYQEKNNAQAKLAFELYVQRIVDYTAVFMNKLERPEAIVFTAGVGENSVIVRKKVIAGLKSLGLELDLKLNQQRAQDYLLISSANSKVPIYVIPTNEELMIAQDALMLEKNQ